MLINGVSYSWSNVSFVIQGFPFIGITEISYDADHKVEMNFGWGRKAISVGYGNSVYTGSITVYREQFLQFISQAGFNDIVDIPYFDVPVTFGGSRVSSTTDVLNSVIFHKDSFKVSQGEMKILQTVPFIFADLEHQL